MALRLIRRLDAWPSDIPWRSGTTIRSPQGVMRSISKSFRRLHLSVEACRRSRPYGSSLPSQYNASCAGRESRALAWKHKPLSDFTVAVENSCQGVRGAKRLKLRVQILFQVT